MRTTLMRILIVLTYSKGLQALYTASMETEIRKETVLAASYDPISRPSSQTDVKVGLNILAIDSLNIKSQTLTIAGWLSFEWEDPRLAWNKSAKDDIEYIFSKPDNIWKPEVIVDNALADLEIITSSALLLRVRSDSVVEWETPLLFTTHCEVDITYYPYDEQKCVVELVSWTYTIDEVDLGHLFEVINLEEFEQHGEWEIIRTSIEEKNITEHLPDGSIRIFPQLDFWLYLRRRTEFYNLNMMMPIILTSLLVVLVFVVPVDSGEKLSYVLTVFLSLAVLLTIVADSLPPTSITVSVLGLYLGVVLVLAASGILLTILILILFHKDGCPVQHSFIVLLTTCATRIIRWKDYHLNIEQTHDENRVTPITALKVSKDGKGSNVINDDDNMKKRQIKGNVDDESDDRKHEFSWKDVAMVLDRFCFFFFLSLTLLVNFAFVIALAAGGRGATD